MKVSLFLFFLMINTFLFFGQTSKVLYQNAKSNLDEGQFVAAIQKTLNIRKKLGRTNPKIEALLCRAYFEAGDFVNAKVAFNKLDKLTPNSIKQSEKFKPYRELEKRIEAALKKEELNFKNNIQQIRINKANSLVEEYNNNNRIKNSKIKNGSRGEAYFFKKANLQGTEEALWDFKKLYKNSTFNAQVEQSLKKIKLRRGELGEIGEFRNGKRHGMWKFYWRNGDVQQNVTYDNGKLFGGLQVFFSKNRNTTTRKKTEVGSYRNLIYFDGRPNSFIQDYNYKTNEIILEGFLRFPEKSKVKDLKEKDFDIDVRFYQSGKNRLPKYVRLTDGIKNGRCKYYYPNFGNRLYLDIEFKNGKPFTVHQSFYRSGGTNIENTLRQGNGKVIYNHYDDSLIPDRILRSFINSKLSEVKKLIEYYKEGKIYERRIIGKIYTRNINQIYKYRRNGSLQSIENYRTPFKGNLGSTFFNNNVEQVLGYSKNSMLVSIKIISSNKSISEFKVTTRPSPKTFIRIIKGPFQPNGMLKSVELWPWNRYERTITDRRGRKKSKNFKKVYEELVFSPSGLIEDILIRKQSNKKIVGRVLNPNRL